MSYYNLISLMPKTAASAFDADAQAFITAAVITDVTQQNAINTLVVDLKGYSIWSKMEALYPMVGGTATTHKFNLKNPLDTDAAFRLVFSGGWTHSVNGATPNGTNAYANTFFNGDTQLITAPSHISCYLRNTQTSNNVPIGASDIAFLLWQMNTINNTGFYYYNGGVASEVLATITTEVGLFLGSTVSATSRKNYINGVLKTTRTTNIAITYPAFNLYLGARNSYGAASTYSNKECAFASIGDGLTDTEAANFYTSVQAFQTTLGRQV
jgi:hypothetical protein